MSTTTNTTPDKRKKPTTQGDNKSWWYRNGIITIAILIPVSLFFVPKLIEVCNSSVFHYAALVCALLLFLYFLFVDYWGKKTDREKGSDRGEKSKNRTFLTIWMVTVGLAIIVVFGIMVITKDDEASKWVFNATIPLIASWIGTVLAFYFGRENFESATDRILQLTKESLDDIPVEQMMISRRTMIYITYENGITCSQGNHELKTIADIVKNYKDNGKDRIPVLTKEFFPLYMVHLTTLDKAATEQPTISFKEFLNEPEHKNFYSQNSPQGFITVRPTLSLEEATKIRLSLEDCRDIFVTTDGNVNSETVGWIPDTLASRFLNLKK